MALYLLLQFAWLSMAFAAAPRSPNGCRTICGDIPIPYPFGISRGCYRDEGFQMACNDTFDPPRLFLGKENNIEVLEISLEGTMKIRGGVSWDCYSGGAQFDQFNRLMDFMEASPYTFSSTFNKFVAVGCNVSAYIGSPESGCISYCNKNMKVNQTLCSGSGCCQADVPSGLKRFDVRIASTDNHESSWAITPCSYAFLVANNDLQSALPNILNGRNFINSYTLPVWLEWKMGGETCAEAERNQSTFACDPNTKCLESVNDLGYICRCPGGSGNPYIIDGCNNIDGCLDPKSNPCQGICSITKEGYNCSCPHGAYGDGRKEGNGCKCLPGYRRSTKLTFGCEDIDECEDANVHKCQHMCYNTEGSYQCRCPDGYHGDGRTDGRGCIASRKPWHLQLAFGLGLGVLFLLIGGYWSYWNSKRRKLIKCRKKFYRQNGGLLLQQKISSHEGIAEITKIFTAEELERATNNYDENRILGQGGHGTVYKGILPGNKLVAVKMSKKLDTSQIEQFINEVVILSQVNHRNIVKLLGCCLETQVPSLVYEYVTNGTLFQHIHNEGIGSSISWENRLRIATEAAGALAYLHSSLSIPIIHRDVKSTNILLDGNYTAKVSDFGASKSVPFDKSHITTAVQGTFGYLDPEYFSTSKLTEKSDVYSFGVVLVELLTGEKPISSTRPEENRNLVTYFICLMNENHLLQALDSQVINEAEEEKLLAIADLAERCLRQKADERPTMKEVETELNGLTRTVGQLSTENHLETGCSLDELSRNYPVDAATHHSLEKQFMMSLDVPR